MTTLEALETAVTLLEDLVEGRQGASVRRRARACLAELQAAEVAAREAA